MAIAEKLRVYLKEHEAKYSLRRHPHTGSSMETAFEQAALALTGSWVSGRGIITRELHLPNTWRQVSLYYRRSFPRGQALQALADTIKANLPNTVQVC